MTHRQQSAELPRRVLPKVLAFILALMAIAQLVKFEDFVQIISSYDLFSHTETLLVAIVLPALQILSLPFLMELEIRPAMRRASIISLLLLPILWLNLVTVALLQVPVPARSGFFGAILHIPIALAVLFSLVLVSLSMKSFIDLQGWKLFKKP